ncbi:camphor resistance protein CrcB [Anaerosporomusa subterranea]|jgi:CrcB protein|uniref:Fluoride-specific ion channel FluC n=1 Tax=Anaerosporomusa subterranea TaxID=1794912 RepID=A0A154BM33_ANASB|nr:fluoride efflux transporter CrcB [Anaerosporomusa subterranea]KYZ74982.1 camphor resistance protein CrcB [Anaerosporomusa subterranea]MDF2500307.1 CrcB-like protein [Anaerosporomusa subterranea]
MDASEWRVLATVAFGGGVGSVCRYAATLWTTNRFGTVMPYGTLLVNVVGCFIIGLFMTVTTERIIINPYWRLLLSVGFLGGLTTFSSFSYETWRLLMDGEVLWAAGNITLNLIVGLVATWLGIALGRLL